MKQKTNTMKYFEESAGEWNCPTVESNILRVNLKGYTPRYRGGCMAIVPNEQKFLIMDEDDDQYTDQSLVTYEELVNYREILYNLSKSIHAEIDFIKRRPKITYIPDKDAFYNQNFSRGGLLVSVEDRGNDAFPHVIIRGYINDRFSIYWVPFRLKVVNSVINLFSK